MITGEPINTYSVVGGNSLKEKWSKATVDKNWQGITQIVKSMSEPLRANPELEWVHAWEVRSTTTLISENFFAILVSTSGVAYRLSRFRNSSIEGCADTQYLGICVACWDELELIAG